MNCIFMKAMGGIAITGGVKTNKISMEYEYDNKDRYVLYLGIAFVLTFVLVVSISIMVNDIKEYTPITKEIEVIGRVTEVKRERSSLFFKVNDTLKYSVRSVEMYNYKNPEMSFGNLLHNQDWIDKRKDSDTILIKKHFTAGRNQYFVFVLGQ